MDSAGWQAEVDRVEASAWPALLEQFQDANLFQTWSYGAIRWGERNLSHLVLRRNQEVAGVAQLRIIRPRVLTGGVAYLRWGPVCHARGRELELETVRAFAAALHEEYARKRRLFLRILPNAFAGSPRAEIFQAAFAGFNGGGRDRAGTERTLLLDLAPPLEELRKRLDQKWRNQLNRAEKNGLTVTEGDGMEDYRIFADMYQQMWERKRFETTVDVGEYARIQEHLPPAQRMKILICRQDSLPVAGIVCSALGDSAIYLLGATSDQGLKAKGAYLLQWTMIQWLKEHGFRYYDLGGIDPELNPGVYHFKSGLSGQDVTRLGPIEACESFASSLCMKLADLVRSGLWRRR